MSKNSQRDWRQFAIWFTIVGLRLALSALNVWVGRVFAVTAIGWAAGDLADWIELRTRRLIRRKAR